MGTRLLLVLKTAENGYYSLLTGDAYASTVKDMEDSVGNGDVAGWGHFTVSHVLKKQLYSVRTTLWVYILVVSRKVKLQTAFLVLLFLALTLLIYVSLRVSSLNAHEKLVHAPRKVVHRQPVVSTLSRRDRHTSFSDGKKQKKEKDAINSSVTINKYPNTAVRSPHDHFSPYPYSWSSFAPGTSDTFSLIILTFNRTDILFRVLNHYCSMAHLERVVVVWNNVNQRPPVERWEELGPHPVPVRFIVQKKNKLRNRLQPFPEIQTPAVLLMDDDLLVAAQDVQFAFRVWKQFPRLIVGFFPRKHVRSASGIYSYGSDEMESQTELGSQAYSMVLTGAAFIHMNYLKMFNSTGVVPKAVHKLIDEMHNCEDLAVNVLVGDYLERMDRAQCPGLFVKPTKLISLEKETGTGYRGMWHDPDHLAERSHCLNHLARIYDGSLPLWYSDIVAIPLRRT